MKIQNAKKVMLPHSQAKLELYGKYFAKYFNIISRDRYTKKIFLFDLFCGEGIYSNGEKGSPIIALETIKNHYFSNHNTCPDIKILFNDIDARKVKKLKISISNIFKPTNCIIHFEQKEYREIIQSVIKTIKSMSNYEKALIFIDPYGYKEIKILDIQYLLEGKHSEVLMFLPISHIYRFINSIKNESNPAVESLIEFLNQIFSRNIPTFNSVNDFINKLLESLRRKFSNFFVDSFTLQRDSRNVYSLFFFTSHIRGFEKMLETKWEIDEDQGYGFRINRTGDLFAGIVHTIFPTDLEKFIKSKEKCSNKDVFEFGLKKGYLPKHINEIFFQWQLEGKLLVYSDNKEKVRKASFYINYENYKEPPKKRVYYKIRN